MESQNCKKSVPQLWYWSQPENGFSFEDAETIAKNLRSSQREININRKTVFFTLCLCDAGHTVITFCLPV